MLKVKLRLESEANSASSDMEKSIKQCDNNPVHVFENKQSFNVDKLDIIAQTYKEFRHLP